MTAGQLVAGMWVILWIMFVGLLIAAIVASFRRGRYTEDEFDRTTIRGSGAIMLAVLLFMLWAGPRVLATWFVLLQYVAGHLANSFLAGFAGTALICAVPMSAFVAWGLQEVLFKGLGGRSPEPWWKSGQEAQC